MADRQKPLSELSQPHSAASAATAARCYRTLARVEKLERRLIRWATSAWLGALGSKFAAHATLHSRLQRYPSFCDTAIGDPNNLVDFKSDLPAGCGNVHECSVLGLLSNHSRFLRSPSATMSITARRFSLLGGVFSSTVTALVKQRELTCRAVIHRPNVALASLIEAEQNRLTVPPVAPTVSVTPDGSHFLIAERDLASVAP